LSGPAGKNVVLKTGFSTVSLGKGRTPVPEKILYKYRGLEPWEFLLDIFVNKRLYAASFQTLNDPMEGVFTYSQDKVAPSFIEQMIDQKMEIRICSLTETHNSTVMWSYYAAAHKGVVLGVNVESNSQNIIAIEHVKYSRDNIFRGFIGSDPATEARKILSKKLTAWKHEKEVRVFTALQFVPISLKVVYLGCQMPPNHRDIVRKLLDYTNPGAVVHDMELNQLDSQVFTGPT
jgi:hypothetical protein